MKDVLSVSEAYAWIEQESSIHVKAASVHGDPIELSADEARELARVLISLANALDELDATTM